jgi:hypothetical protein
MPSGWSMSSTGIDVASSAKYGERTTFVKMLRISRSRERSDRRDVNSWIGDVNAQIAGT